MCWQMFTADVFFCFSSVLVINDSSLLGSSCLNLPDKFELSFYLLNLLWFLTVLYLYSHYVIGQRRDDFACLISVFRDVCALHGVPTSCDVDCI